MRIFVFVNPARYVLFIKFSSLCKSNKAGCKRLAKKLFATSSRFAISLRDTEKFIDYLCMLSTQILKVNTLITFLFGQLC